MVATHMEAMEVMEVVIGNIMIYIIMITVIQWFIFTEEDMVVSMDRFKTVYII